MMTPDDYLIACQALNQIGGNTVLQHCACGALGLVECRPAEPFACAVRFVEKCPQCRKEPEGECLD